MNVKFYSLSSLPVAVSSAAGSFVNVTAGDNAGMYYCDGSNMIRLDNVSQDTTSEIHSASVDTSTGIVSFFNSKDSTGTALFTVGLSDYIAAEVAKLAGSATIATAKDGVVTIKGGVTETSGVITNTSDATDITLAKVATTGMAADITLNPHSKFNDGSDSDQATVQDAIDTIAEAFDGLVKDTQDAINALTSTVTAVSNGVTVTVVETSGKLASVSVDAGTAAGKDVLDGKIADAGDSDADELVNVEQVKAYTAGLVGAMHFRAAVSGDTAASALATISNASAGDVALYGTAEYVYDGTQWVLFGDEGAYDVIGAAASALVSAKAYSDAITVNGQAQASQAITIDAADINVDDSAATKETVAAALSRIETNALKGVQVNGSDLTVTDNKVNVTVSTGTSNGTVSVNGADVAVSGLGSAAYTAVSDYVSEVVNADDSQYVTVTSKDSSNYQQTLSVTIGSFTVPATASTSEVAQVSGLATVEAVEKVITDNEKVTSTALNDLNTRVSALEEEDPVTTTVSGDDGASTGVKVNVSDAADSDNDHQYTVTAEMVWLSTFPTA